MTHYITGGARFTKGGDPILTKKVLKLLIKEDPHLVEFFPTSSLGGTFEGPLNKLPMDFTLVITGPDPHFDRRWQASIIRNHQDQVKVS